ncbi:testis-expressed protein 2 isoform X1 [Nothobranchius furzeri]|uniref:Testis expressed 2 n=1 Tax=Nothobranchius furzeri TaxID=105023 RepID=A0A8C6PN54_NOTFU|nr:testis-expressed protein 2 isoform X1 [Nothobranchius furzeri]XP_015822185.1 testis-expressed protein 2 isoform X1 [Nothobranchius furzeri]KAF7223704.1 transcript variant X1 [Nothobranchius furzeri]KAF7223706.1 transcript variant X2 [Nothobranchius furzeri]
MTSQHPSHAESSHSSDNPPPVVGSKLHAQGPLSKENITVHISLGKKEEEEEDELYSTSDFSASAALGDSNIVTAVEAIEEMFDPAAEVPVIPDSSRCSPSSSNHTNRSPTQALSSHIPEQKPSTISSSPIKSLSFPSSLVKSLSSDVDARDGVTSAPAPSVRQRPLMKSLVKSLSSDTSQDSSSSSTTQRLLDSRLNLQLFRQFAQSRMASASVTSVSDSKTAPSSPLASPDNRSFFKVSEVEARIEDTKRRLTEAIAEPLQLLSKIMDEKSGGLVGGSIYRPKGLSTSATELSTLSLVNGSLENNNCCIKEEERPELEVESPNSWTSVSAESLSDLPANTKSPSKSSLLSMSALAKQEEEDFCILTSEDFETCTDTEGDGVNGLSRTGSQAPLSGSSDPSCDDECEDAEAAPAVPFYTLMVLTALVYACFVLPLPSYVRGLLLGLAFGFYLAIGVVWLAGPKRSGRVVGSSRNKGKLENAARVDIKEPEIYKGWMNEILSYDPETYHATLTHSVYVRLEGSTIRLSKPNHNITRRASHKEPKPDVTFISQKIYDLTNCKVYLAPQNLAKKRVWNKKYPICLQLSKQDDFMSKAEGDQVEFSESTSSREDGERTSGVMERPSSSSSSTHLTLFLFGRTGREKEDWFQRFLLASHVRVESKKASCVGGTKKAVSKSHSRNSSRSSLNEMLSSLPKSKDSAAAGSAKSKLQLDFTVYMSSFLPKQQSASTAASSSASSLQGSPVVDKKLQTSALHPREEEDGSVAWVNAAVARLLWDFLTKPCWAEMVSKKIQMKLSKIRLPYFMNELTLTELDMGSASPRILRASTPSMDYRGLWFDLEVSYYGSFLMTLETKMILNRLGKEGESLRFGDIGRDGVRPRAYCLAASDEESSSAGSSDEEDSSDLSNDSAGAEGLVGGHKPSKIMRFVDKIAKSKYFQKATETEFIKKKMEEVSNTPLLLTVEVQELRGTLAVNIPPPPTDRIWYGFRTPPHLELKARPKLGEREVTLAHVTDWIERKLEQEFMKILVMPNMDDVWLDIMHPAMITHPSDGPSPPHTQSTEPSWQETDGQP